MLDFEFNAVLMQNVELTFCLFYKVSSSPQIFTRAVFAIIRYRHSDGVSGGLVACGKIRERVGGECAREKLGEYSYITCLSPQKIAAVSIAFGSPLCLFFSDLCSLPVHLFIHGR